MTTSEATDAEKKAWDQLKQVPTQPARPTATGMLAWRREHIKALDNWINASNQKIDAELAEKESK